jgi:hypothetical protein
VGFVVDKVALGQVFPPDYFGFSLGALLLGKVKKKTDHLSLHLHHRVAQ